MANHFGAGQSLIENARGTGAVQGTIKPQTAGEILNGFPNRLLIDHAGIDEVRDPTSFTNLLLRVLQVYLYYFGRPIGPRPFNHLQFFLLMCSTLNINAYRHNIIK